MSRHAFDHREWDDASQWDSAQALDDSDNLLALEQRAERSAARAVIGWALTGAGVMLCGAIVAGVL